MFSARGNGRGIPLAVRLWGRCVWTSSDCLEYMAGRHPQGYGVITYEGKRIKTHRAAWMLMHGSLPPVGEVVRHTCDNPPCCAPWHLLRGTQQQNVADMMARGRWCGPPRKTHCSAGHEIAGDNLRINKTRGYRTCRTCDNESRRIYQNRRRAAHKERATQEVTRPRCDPTSASPEEKE